ncbi:hypothetical protein RIF29_31865 [Crotalaria pallida]|uniref:GATA-type domain-containing protein n=1 Tax=Crotalaria pallida TaxID=3830 RepID=A0AAN9EHK0_CROPI
MKDYWLLDNNFNGLSDGILDERKFFDFKIEDEENDVLEVDWAAQFKHLEEPSLGVFSVSSSGICDKTHNETPKLGNGSTSSAYLEKTARPTYGKTIPNQYVRKDVHRFQTYSPVSVFESSSSSSVENSNFDLPVIPAKRPRGKRQRLSSFNLLLSLPFISTSPDFVTQTSGKFVSRGKKQRKKDLVLLPDHNEMKRCSSKVSGATGKCTHCAVTETPQWREGPMGPKTLCNACGVRYRSGRLFPEYRPAASPTFVPSLHSNSHRKVIEMRNRAATKETFRGPSVMSL